MDYCTTPKTLQEMYAQFESERRTTIRGRLNENVGKHFRRIGKGIYETTEARQARTQQRDLKVKDDGMRQRIPPTSRNDGEGTESKVKGQRRGHNGQGAPDER